MDFRGELWYTSESWKVKDRCRHHGCGEILTTIDAPRFSDCRSLRTRSQKNRVVVDLLMPLMFGGR